MRISRPPRWVALSALLSAVVLLAAAGAASTSTLAAAGRAHRASPALVKTAAAKVLVNAQGMTLYIFTLDKPGKSVCTGKCAAIWPPLVVPKGTAAPTAMAGIKGKFGVTTRAGGVRQLTYDGAPLYTFAKDKKPGDVNGQGFGGVWWAVLVSGESTGGSGSSSGGY